MARGGCRMRLFLSPCSKFRHLLNASDDRPLLASEAMFMACHEERCSKCSRYETSSDGLNLLRTAGLDANPTPGFTDRTLRLVRIQAGRTTFNYWLPDIAGGVIACVALVSALQMISRPQAMPTFMKSGVESRKIDISETMIPSLDLSKSPVRRTP